MALDEEEKLTGIDELRQCVEWLDYHDEGFLEKYSLMELIRLWRYTGRHSEINEFADTWTQEQLELALMG